MSSNSRMTRSKGPVEEFSLPPTRVRKDVSTANEGEENAQGQVQANVPSQQRTVDMPSPFARPGSRAGTCTTPASDEGMLPKASNPFTRPDSRAGFAPPVPTVVSIIYERQPASRGREYVSQLGLSRHRHGRGSRKYQHKTKQCS